MATLDARLARQAAAERRTNLALEAIGKLLGIEFERTAMPKGVTPDMERVLLAEQSASWMEAVAIGLENLGKKPKGKKITEPVAVEEQENETPDEAPTDDITDDSEDEVTTDDITDADAETTEDQSDDDSETL